MTRILFRSADRQLYIKDKTVIKAFIEQLFKKEKTALEALTYVFCSDAFLLDMNRDFLQHDYYTDIISFALSEKGMPVEGEIYISTDRVKDNARSFGIPLREEALRVIFHGALHLCGYKDKKKSEIALMRKKENQYLRLFEKQLANG